MSQLTRIMHLKFLKGGNVSYTLVIFNEKHIDKQYHFSELDSKGPCVYVGVLYLSHKLI